MSEYMDRLGGGHIRYCAVCKLISCFNKTSESSDKFYCKLCGYDEQGITNKYGPFGKEEYEFEQIKARIDKALTSK